MKKLLILSNNYTSDKVAGIAIRFMEIAKALSKDLDVTLALSKSDGYSSNDFEIAGFKTDNDILGLLKRHDVALTRGLDIVGSKKLSNSGIPMIFDLLCPFFFEGLESEKNDQKAFNASLKDNRALIEKLAKRGDFFICANEEQRDFWLANLYQCGRIDHKTYNADPSLKNLIDIVPFGLEPASPVHSKKALKGTVPGIKETDKVIIWFGGLWDWLDPLSVIEAVKNISRKRNDIKLVFVGGKHPNPSTKPHEMLKKTIDAAAASGLNNKTIFFIDWVAYNERANYLLESDIGIITHNDNLETRFSWRTRVLDYFWTDLPTILTKGDPMSRVIEKNGLGKTVNYNDPKDIENAILEICDHPAVSEKIRSSINSFKERLSWNTVVAPIVNFCKDPKRTSQSPNFIERMMGK